MQQICSLTAQCEFSLYSQKHSVNAKSLLPAIPHLSWVTGDKLSLHSALIFNIKYHVLTNAEQFKTLTFWMKNKVVNKKKATVLRGGLRAQALYRTHVMNPSLLKS
jgi:hypothetical protein